MPSVEQIRDRVRGEIIAFQVFKSADGKTVLDRLRREFGDSTSPKDGNTNGFIYKSGQRDVLLFIEDMIERGNNE